MVIRSGSMEYTQRANLQDVQQAMKGDIVRALLELLTNADDAYDAKGGDIFIRIEKENNFFHLSVQDSAIGLGAEQMVNHFTKIGGQNEKFNSNKGTRGLFGRGAKDVTAFGTTVFSAVKDGKFSLLELDGKNFKWDLKYADQDLKNEEIEKFGFKKSVNGLKATIILDDEFNLTSAPKLINKLKNHAQLRDLLNRNNVFYEDVRSKVRQKLTYESPKSTPLLSEEFSIDGYKHKVKLEISRLEKKESTQVSPYTNHGLLITGKGACYENSFLHLNSRPEIGWITGRLIAPEIDELVRALDRSDYVPTPENSTRLIARDREGLVREHKYYRSLCGLLDKVLVPILEQIGSEEGATRKESAELRKKFDSLERVLGDVLQKILNESESGDLPLGDENQDGTSALSIIPPKKILAKDELVTLSVRAFNNVDTKTLKLSLSNQEIIEVTTTDLNDLVWSEHPRLNLNHTTLTVKALKLGRSEIRISNDELVTKCEIIVVENKKVLINIPTTLEFLYPERSMPPLSKKKIQMIAPIEFVGEEVTISLENKLIDASKAKKFYSDLTGSFATTNFSIDSSEDLGSCKITAQMLNMGAECTIRVKEVSKNKIPKMRFELNGSVNPPRRVDTLMENNEIVVKIFGFHKSLTRIFGDYKNDKFEGESSIEGAVTISEILGSQLAIYAVEREAEMHPDRFPDASSVFVRHQERTSLFIPIIQAGMLAV